MRNRLDRSRGRDWTPVAFADDGFADRQAYMRKRQKALEDARPKVREIAVTTERQVESTWPWGGVPNRMQELYGPIPAPIIVGGTVVPANVPDGALMEREIRDEGIVDAVRIRAFVSQEKADMLRQRRSRERWYENIGVTRFILAIAIIIGVGVASVIWFS